MDGSLQDSLRVVRIFTNLDAICYANSVMTGLAWIALKIESLHPNCWADQSCLIGDLTTATPMPILLPQLQTFVPLWNSWGQEHPLNRQHDVREFLDHVLSVLKPTFWGGQTCLQWASGDTSLEALQHRGSKWLTLTISTSHAGHDNFQHLISKWHDQEGLQQSFLIAGRAIAVHLDRRMGLDEVKTYTQILFPSNWQIELPFLIPPIDALSSEWFVKMLDYSIVGLTWHDGGQTTGGHYRTLLRQGDKWFHYDDNCNLPEIITVIPPHILQRVTLIWMIRLE